MESLVNVIHSKDGTPVLSLSGICEGRAGVLEEGGFPLIPPPPSSKRAA
jgi:hypothetical protein